MSVPDVEAIHAAVRDEKWGRRWAYFAGPHPAIFVTPKHQRVFAGYAERMGERNYCSLAVKARLARLQITGFSGPDADEAQRIFEESRLFQRQDRWYRWALAYGQSWLVVDTEQRTIVPNKPTMVAALPSLDDPDTYRVGGKTWQAVDEDGETVDRAVLWYPDESIEYEKRDGQWRELDSYSQPAGMVPLVNSDPFGDGPVLMDTLRPGADRVNRIGANKMVAGDFAAFAQWVFITRQEFDDSSGIGGTPGEAIILEPGEDGLWQAAVHQMQYTPLSNYDQSKDSEVDDLMSLASLPRHMRVNPGAPPSGDAVKADEGPLIEDVEDHQRELGESAVEGLRMLDVDAEPIWKDPTPHDDLGQSQEFALLAPQIGWESAGRQVFGWDDDTVARIRRTNTPINGDPTGADLLAEGA